MNTQDFPIREIPDFPKPGILFYDITTLLACPKSFAGAIEMMAAKCQDSKAAKLVAIESRGYFFAAALAVRLGKGLLFARKKGHYPFETIECSFELEYGYATLCMAKDSLVPGEEVIIIDDLLATGGTIGAAAKIVRAMRAKVDRIVVFMELEGLNGRAALPGLDVQSILKKD